jgi:hypothetical protein
MAVSVQEQILRFQVAVDNIHAVQVVQGQSDFSCIKLGNRVREALHISS